MRLAQNVVIASLAGLGCSAQAVPVSYTIDEARSVLSITSGSVVVAGVFTFPAEPLDANGFTAAVGGHLDAELTNAAIRFASSSRVTPVEHGLYLPGHPASPSTPAPGSYAIHYPTAPALGFDFDSITRGLVFEWNDTLPHAIVGGEYAPTGTAWTVIAGVADLSAGNPPQSDLTTVAPFQNITLGNGVIAREANVETLTTPVQFTFVILGGFINVTLDYEGSIVAARSVPGCPGDLNHDNLVDDADFVLFVEAYNLLEVPPANAEADLNGDGVVDDADFVIFVTSYNELMCPE